MRQSTLFFCVNMFIFPFHPNFPDFFETSPISQNFEEKFSVNAWILGPPGGLIKGNPKLIGQPKRVLREIAKWNPSYTNFLTDFFTLLEAKSIDFINICEKVVKKIEIHVVRAIS